MQRMGTVEGRSRLEFSRTFQLIGDHILTPLSLSLPHRVIPPINHIQNPTNSTVKIAMFLGANSEKAKRRKFFFEI